MFDWSSGRELLIRVRFLDDDEEFEAELHWYEAHGIVTDSDVILADEPTGNLDAASARDVLTLLGRLDKEFGKTLVMVTHDPGAAKTASTIRYLEKGKLLPEGERPVE